MHHEAEGVSNSSVVDWCNFIREECQVWLENNSKEIGGMDVNEDSIVDESKYFHRKYHTEQWSEGHWVFGGIERLPSKCFLVEVPDHMATTLGFVIEQYILPGSHITSDGLATYSRIDTIQLGIYMHSLFVHERNFVNLDDHEIHTHNVENMWMRAKRKL